MIEFNGTITCKAAIFFEKLWFKSVSFALIVTFVIFECLPIYLAIAVSIDYLIYVVCIAIVFLLAFLVLIFNKKSDSQKSLHEKLVIDTDEQTVVAYYSSYEIFRMFDEIQSIEDHGEWYNFIFKRRTKFIAAQKDLITKGTIEEFEKIFEEVLVRVK